MPEVRGVFRVTRITKFRGSVRVGAYVRLESTDPSAIMFGAQLDLMTTDPQMIATFDVDAEVTVDVIATGRKF
jgi:hypothetical protein